MLEDSHRSWPMCCWRLVVVHLVARCAITFVKCNDVLRRMWIETNFVNSLVPLEGPCP